MADLNNWFRLYLDPLLSRQRLLHSTLENRFEYQCRTHPSQSEALSPRHIISLRSTVLMDGLNRLTPGAEARLEDLSPLRPPVTSWPRSLPRDRPLAMYEPWFRNSPIGQTQHHSTSFSLKCYPSQGYTASNLTAALGRICPYILPPPMAFRLILILQPNVLSAPLTSKPDSALSYDLG